jgi:hypothetical protein
MSEFTGLTAVSEVIMLFSEQGSDDDDERSTLFLKQI